MPLEIKTADEQTFKILTAEEIDQGHAKAVEEWLPDCLQEISEIVPSLIHPGESAILHEVSGKNSDPCLIERLNAELEDTCFYIKMDDVGEGDSARSRPKIFRLNGTQREAVLEAKRSTRNLGLMVFFGLLSVLSYIVASNMGLM
ncbi:MAG: hypothetical protein HOE06_06115 [Candidatus Thioglobus sp.]|jgi:hypothetical protein|nr:hypothetical protein [Candidatus Thioglobus sp.]